MTRALVALPLMVAGVLAGHQVTYERSAAQLGEHAAMTMTGQSWLPSAPSVMLVLSLLLLAGVLAAKYSTTRLVSPWPILLMQSASLVLLEVVDRVLHGCCLFPSLPQALAGLALQIPAAAVIAVLGAVAAPLLLLLTTVPCATAPAVSAGKQTCFTVIPVLRTSDLRWALRDRGPPLPALAL